MANQRQTQNDANYVENFKNCLEKEKPFCQAACPFHLDVSGFIDKMKRGAYKAAYKTYRDVTGFPGIVAELCTEPCKAVCPRSATDSAIELRLLEKSAVDYAGDNRPTAYNLPHRNKKIAVIGAGISGLACALRLAAKKFDVTIYEKSGRIGGELWNLLPDGRFLAEIENQFLHEEYTLRLNTEIKSLEELGDMDAIYIATGKGGNDFGMGRSHENGIFTGGMLLGDDLIEALADGLNTATAIDNLLKTGRELYPEDKRETGTILDPSLLKKIEPVGGTLPGGAFTKEEAVTEAQRCIQCKCSACYLNRDLIQYTNKWPLRMRDEIAATTLPGWSEVKATPAKRLLSTCNLSGECVDVCPKEIDLDRLILDGRRSMHNQDKTPWVFYEFWIRDMDFADGEDCAIRRMPNDVEKSKYAFFPGCQLGASRPELVDKTFGYLRDKMPDTGLLLQCCGAPGEWAGIDERHRESIAGIRAAWESMGRPTLILACPTCGRKFRDYMPEIQTIFIYELLEQLGFQADSEKIRALLGDGMIDGGMSIFDPCASRHMFELQKSARKFAGEIGCELMPLAENGPNAKCCGFGGQPGITDPAYEKFVRERRIAEGDKPYITYCVNCRDAFLDAGKPAVHLLDILFPQNEDPAKDLYHLPTVTERRQYREELKKKLLKKYWGEEMKEQMNEEMNQAMNQDSVLELVMTEELRQKISRERILEEDLKEVIGFCQRTKRRVFNEEAGTYSGYRQIGHMTYWVEYVPETEERIRLVNAYSHRMKIELEAVWNGRKIETDM